MDDARSATLSPTRRFDTLAVSQRVSRCAAIQVHVGCRPHRPGAANRRGGNWCENASMLPSRSRFCRNVFVGFPATAARI